MRREVAMCVLRRLRLSLSGAVEHHIPGELIMCNLLNVS